MKKEDTKQHILETASRLFYDKGYNLTGINEIIAEAGIAKATLYSHFKTKDDLCIAYLDYRSRELLTQLDAFCNQRPMGRERVLAILEFLLPFFETENFAGCWCIRTVAEVPAEKSHIRDQIKHDKQVFMTFIKQVVMINLSHLSEPDQEKLSRRIYLIYESAIGESHLHGESWPILEGIDLLNSLLN